MKKAFFLTLAAVSAVSVSLAAPVSAQGFNAFKDPVQASSSGGAVAGPDLKAVADITQAGNVTVGATAYFVVLFRNNGSSPVNVTTTNLYPSSTVAATVSLNKCQEAPLPPEAQCAITLAVTGVQTGSWRVEMLLDHDGRTRLAVAALSGTVEGGDAKKDDQVNDDIEALPNTLDFGSTNVVAPLVRAILFRNRTSKAVKLNGIWLDSSPQSGFSTRSECPEALESGESCVVNVTWSPSSKGIAEGVLVVDHSAKSRLTKVDIKGNFSPTATAGAGLYPESVPDKGLLVSDRAEIAFGDGVEGVSAITISLVNAGAAELSLKSIRLAGSDNGLTIARAGCEPGLTLQPVDACVLTVGWAPTRMGPVIDDLQITHTGARGVLVLPIRGVALAAARDSAASRQMMMPSGAAGADGGAGSFGGGPGFMPSLDGYVITSHAPTKAVINGPAGSIVVRDGEDVVISGVKWTVSIVPSGVVLGSEGGDVMLLFDKALRSLETAPSGGSSGGEDSSGASSSGSSQGGSGAAGALNALSQMSADVSR